MTTTSKNRKIEKSTTWRAAALVALVLAPGVVANAQEAGPAPAKSAPTKAKVKASAPELVHRGNKLLLDEKPGEAIELYDEAQRAAPDAREIAFGKGLGYYKLGEFDKARAAFEEAAAAKDDALADDALYSIGTVDHAQALAGEGGDPKTAMSKLESAMQSYQGVLARNPQHEAARDANLKAATMWRQIKEQVQQQQQQQQGDQNQDQNRDQQQEQQKKDQESQDQKQQQDQQSQPQDQQQQDKQDQQQQNQQQKQDQQQQQQGEASEQKQQDQKQSAQEQKQEQEPQQSAEQQEPTNEEQVSREQAERQLREMIQSLRDRKKERREQAKPMPIRRAEKDW